MKKITFSKIVISLCIIDLLTTYLMGLKGELFARLLFIWMPMHIIAIPVFGVALIAFIVISITRKKLYKNQIISLLIVLLLLIFTPPKALYAGAVSSLKIAGEKQILAEAKILMELHKKQLEKNKDKDAPLESYVEVPPNELPKAMKKLSPLWVRVYKKEVIVKKFGLGDVSGFLITADDKNAGGLYKISKGIYWVDE